MASTTIYRAIAMAADKNGNVRFRILSHGRTFPIKYAEGVASIKEGATVYVGTMNDAICGRGHNATDAELADWGLSR